MICSMDLPFIRGETAEQFCNISLMIIDDENEGCNGSRRRRNLESACAYCTCHEHKSHKKGGDKGNPDDPVNDEPDNGGKYRGKR